RGVVVAKRRRGAVKKRSDGSKRGVSRGRHGGEGWLEVARLDEAVDAGDRRIVGFCVFADVGEFRFQLDDHFGELGGVEDVALARATVAVAPLVQGAAWAAADGFGATVAASAIAQQTQPQAGDGPGLRR